MLNNTTKKRLTPPDILNILKYLSILPTIILTLFFSILLFSLKLQFQPLRHPQLTLASLSP